MKDYTKRIYRIAEILYLLDRGEVHIKELPARFNVSLRTIQRDLKIIEESGFPIYNPSKGKIKFIEGFNLKKVKITEEEAGLLSFFYEISKNLGKNFEESFKNILKKIFPPFSLNIYYMKLPQVYENINEEIFESLKKAIEEKRVIEIDYELRRDEKKKYNLSPLKIVYYEGFWYLLSYVHRKDWVLTLRLDKIKNIKFTSFYFEDDGKFDTLLTESVNIWFSERKKKKATLKINKDIAEFFRKKKYFPYQKIEKILKDGSLIISCKFSQEMEIIPQILSWIPHIKVIFPLSMKNNINNILKKYLKNTT